MTVSCKGQNGETRQNHDNPDEGATPAQRSVCEMTSHTCNPEELWSSNLRKQPLASFTAGKIGILDLPRLLSRAARPVIGKVRGTFQRLWAVRVWNQAYLPWRRRTFGWICYSVRRRHGLTQEMLPGGKKPPMGMSVVGRDLTPYSCTVLRRRGRHVHVQACSAEIDFQRCVRRASRSSVGTSSLVSRA